MPRVNLWPIVVKPSSIQWRAYIVRLSFIPSIIAFCRRHWSPAYLLSKMGDVNIFRFGSHSLQPKINCNLTIFRITLFCNDSLFVSCSSLFELRSTRRHSSLAAQSYTPTQANSLFCVLRPPIEGYCQDPILRLQGGLPHLGQGSCCRPMSQAFNPSTTNDDSLRKDRGQHTSFRQGNE